jgi:hypothetical protein
MQLIKQEFANHAMLLHMHPSVKAQLLQLAAVKDEKSPERPKLTALDLPDLSTIFPLGVFAEMLHLWRYGFEWVDLEAILKNKLPEPLALAVRWHLWRELAKSEVQLRLGEFTCKLLRDEIQDQISHANRRIHLQTTAQSE